MRIIHFFIALVLAIVFVPCSLIVYNECSGAFIVHREIGGIDHSWLICFPIIVFVLGLLCIWFRELTKKTFELACLFHQLSIMLFATSAFYFARYIEDAGLLDGAIDGFLVGVIACVILMFFTALCFAFIGKGLMGLINGWNYPALVVNGFVFGIYAFLSWICLWGYMLEESVAVALIALLGVTGIAGGKEIEDVDEVYKDANGTEFKAYQIGDYLMDGEHGISYHKGLDGKWYRKE